MSNQCDQYLALTGTLEYEHFCDRSTKHAKQEVNINNNSKGLA